MSLDTDSRATTRRVVPTVREKTSPSMRLASLSQRFFSKGEEQEANGYQNVVLEPDDATSAPDLKFDSFDKIPRRRRPLLTITALLVSLPAVGYVAWTSTRGMRGPSASVNESAQAMVGGQPAAAEPPVPTTQAGGPSGGLGAPANPAPAQPPVILSGSCPPAETAPAAAAPSIAPAPTVEPKAEISPPAPAAKAATKAEPEARAAATAESEASRPAAKARSSGSALHGYVWSPEANALVPATEPRAEPSAEPQADSMKAEPSAAMPRPTAAPEPTAPPAEKFKVAPPRRTAEPVERPAPPPPELAAPIIE